jgi:hypothetical protein
MRFRRGVSGGGLGANCVGILGVALALNGCAAHYYVFSTEQRRYLPGDTVRLTLVNHTGETLQWSFCGLTLERKTGVRWVEVGNDLREGPFCGLAMRGISGARTSGHLTAPFRIDSLTLPGEYRIRMPVDWGKIAPKGPVTDPFEVSALPSR